MNQEYDSSSGRSDSQYAKDVQQRLRNYNKDHRQQIAVVDQISETDLDTSNTFKKFSVQKKRSSMENMPASPPSFGQAEAENQASFNLLLSLTDTRETQILIRRKLARQSASLPTLSH